MSSETREPAQPPPAGYAFRIAPAVFDFMVSWLFWPTSIATLRDRLVDLLEVDENTRVLEFGSGTGGITERLLRRGAQVTCVDRAPAMMERARARAPAASFVLCDALDYKSERPFDRAILALFLHESMSADRVAILRAARKQLVPDGLMVVADSSAPASGLRRTLWRGFLRTFEPATVLEVVDGALLDEMPQAGLAVVRSESLAGGRLTAHVARPV